MSQVFQPISAEQLYAWVFSELNTRDSIFGIPRRHFFYPQPDAPYNTIVYGHRLETPFGPAAGPHSQMAQNIVASWLCGARYIELKTVQTVDVLDVAKPCIDMEDEGYNVEWSQELRINQSFDEYLRAWVLIHALHHKLGFPGDSPGIIFNISVGYDLEGIAQPNMQWFLDRISDCSEDKQTHVEQIARHYPRIRKLNIPDCISDNVTLSTMHGCPPGEIERIGIYLLRERKLHTLVKCNPTLLGPEKVRTLLNEYLKYHDVTVPDVAFEHDLKYRDAVPMLGRLQKIAKDSGLDFGVKLSNTLEVENFRPVFAPSEKTMYLSGRPLHAITVNLAHVLAEQFHGNLPMSFSAGANCFNAPALLAAGMQTITVCSDLLKTGGYLRLLQYLESVEAAFHRAGATTIRAFILRSTGTETHDVRSAALINLRHYALQTRNHSLYRKDTFETSHTKTPRKLEPFDCIRAPCIDRCALDQKIPQYLGAVRDGDFAEALRIIRADNPLPCTLGRVCDHLCEQSCVRNHLDEPVAIRDIKRFVMDHAAKAGVAGPAIADESASKSIRKKKVAIIGAGPAGLAAATELARRGCAVEIFEQQSYVGGMPGGVVPEYRLPKSVFDQDFSVLKSLGIQVHLGMKAGRDFHLSQLRHEGFHPIVIAVGAQQGKALGSDRENCDGVIDALQFLRRAREGHASDIGNRIGVIGGGDSAMDCARVAWRSSDAQVTLIYRRTVDQMPADREEIAQLIEEGIEVLELTGPQRLDIEDGKLRALVCRRMVLTNERDASGRRIAREIPDSDFVVPLDTLIIAISQQAVLDFFDQEPIAVNEAGYIQVDPVTFETSVPGVYAGGDVVNEGPASIVKAAAAGKAIANSILQLNSSSFTPAMNTAVNIAALLRRRSRRQWRVPARQIPARNRRNFDEVVLTYTEQQARAEAARCLDCDTYCSICVGVCPNMALQTYQTDSFAVALPQLRLEDNTIRIGPGISHQVRQRFQVAVLTDLCNECGNCATFCPTAGQPYRDKPRLYLGRRDFLAQPDNAFMVFRDGDRWAMDARWGSATHRIELNGLLHYTTPWLQALIDPETFEIVEIETTRGATGADPPSLAPCAAMYVLLNGLAKSIPFLPVAQQQGSDCADSLPSPHFDMAQK